MSKRDPKKIEFVQAVQSLGRSQNAYAESQAVSAFRSPKDKEQQEAAAKAVMAADIYKAVSDQVIDLVEKFWSDKEAS